MRTDEDWHHAQRIWKMERRAYRDEEQAEYFRKHKARTILDLSYTKTLPIEKCGSITIMHLPIGTLSEVVFGHWLQFERGGAQSRLRNSSAAGRQSGLCRLLREWAGPAFHRAIRSGIRSTNGRSISSPLMILCGLTGSVRVTEAERNYSRSRASPPYRRGGSTVPELNVLAARPAYPWRTK